MSDNHKDPVDKEDQISSEDRPIGAVIVTSFLMIVILVLWFSIYILDIVRS